MKHQWVVDVLQDLRRYAQANDLTALADRMTAVNVVADAEIEAVEERLRAQDDDEASFFQTNYRVAGALRGP